MANEAGTKLVLVICDQGVEPDVMEALQTQGLSHYTRWTDCQGSGETGVREGSPIWPGLNTIVMIVMAGEQVEPLRAALDEVRRSFPITPGLKMVITDALIV